MYRSKTETKLVWWPTPQDYNEAIQFPQANLHDSDLRKGLPYTNALDLPRSITGSFASVYRMHCQNRDFAVRLFLSNIHDQHERYALISDFVQHDTLPYTVTFDFLKEGIKIHGEWLPALKMDWLEGEQLDDYIVANLHQPDKLGSLLDKFVKMMDDMRAAGIAHGDLQHGNILVCNDELRLVDYDGMFVPSMKGFTAGELGHRNYQHPERAAHHFGPYLDNFSAWVIYASLRALQIDSRLMHQLGGGDDCLLFRQTDFMDPLHSAAFAALEKHADSRLIELGRFIRLQLKNNLPEIPPLAQTVPTIPDHDLHPVAESASTLRSGARLIRGTLPDWMQGNNIEALTGSSQANVNDAITPAAYIRAESNLLAQAPNEVPPAWVVPAKSSQHAAWIKPSAVKPKQSNVSTKKDSKPQQVSSRLPPTPTQSTQSSPPVTVLTAVPVELQTTTPRKVKWNYNATRMNPVDLVPAMVIFNPVIWYMIYFYNTVPIAGGQPAAAVLYSVLCAITSCLTICVCLQDPFRDWILIRDGQPLLARIETVRINPAAAPFGKGHYQSDISFNWNGQERYRTINLNNTEFMMLKKGSVQIIFYDETTDRLTLYRFCRYHAVKP